MKKPALLDLLKPENSGGTDNRRLKVNRACLPTCYKETLHHRLASESTDRDERELSRPFDRGGLAAAFLVVPY